MEAAIIGLIGAIVGVGLTLIANLILNERQRKNEVALELSRWSEERDKERMKNIRETLSQYVDKIEKYSTERRSLIKAINNPILRPETVYHSLFSEIWRTASIADEATVIARALGNDQLSNDLLELERAFWEMWNIKTQHDTEKNSEILENKTQIIYSRITINILELRARISQFNMQEQQLFNVNDLPKLIENK